jgi:hypothetical protein
MKRAAFTRPFFYFFNGANRTAAFPAPRARNPFLIHLAPPEWFSRWFGSRGSNFQFSTSQMLTFLAPLVVNKIIFLSSGVHLACPPVLECLYRGCKQ